MCQQGLMSHFYYTSIQEMSKKRFVFLKGDVQLKAQHPEVFLEFVERREVFIYPPILTCLHRSPILTIHIRVQVSSTPKHHVT